MEFKPWLLTTKEVLKSLNTSKSGLSNEEAKERLKKHGLNNIIRRKEKPALKIFLSQLKNPLILLIVIASIVAGLLGERTEAIVMISIIFLNIALGFFQEYKSEKELQKLTKLIKFKCKVFRDNNLVEIDTRQLTVGDIVLLRVGDIVPADLRLIETDELSIDESIITGESYPVPKTKKIIQEKEFIPQKLKNIAFTGTSVVGGSGIGVVYAVSNETYLGKTAGYFRAEVPPTDFQKNMKKFGDFLLKIVLGFVIFIFAVNSFLGKPIIDSLLFSLAIAVGIIPETLPIVVTLSLSHGALKLANKKVIVKKLEAMEDFGNINVLCMDKTGTLTENEINLVNFMDVKGKKEKRLLLYSALCTSVDIKGNRMFGNPLDIAILKQAKKLNLKTEGFKIIDEIPFDSQRKRMSVVVKKGKEYILISKGLTRSILSTCDKVVDGKRRLDIKKFKDKIEEKCKELNSKGYRSVAIAIKRVKRKNNYNVIDEKHSNFLGVLTFLDPPKLTAKNSLKELKKLGIETKILTGDDPLITAEVARKVGFEFSEEEIITGEEIRKVKDLKTIVEKKKIFARLMPEQKFNILKALHENGHVTGYLGDGVNDAPALRIADVGISVDSGADVAKEAADIILMRKSLRVIAEGVIEGRRTFTNITKYINNTTSANIGNVVTIALASLFLKFLPLLPSQVLLADLLSDLPLLSISTDKVDEDELVKPRRWSINYISRFSFTFGALSVLFDLITIMFLLNVFLLGETQFRTGWFLETVLSEILVTFAIRTKKPFFKSVPSKLLLSTSIIVALVSIYLPYSLLNNVFGFTQLGSGILEFIFLVLLNYFVFAEIIKPLFRKFLKESETFVEKELNKQLN